MAAKSSSLSCLESNWRKGTSALSICAPVSQFTLSRWGSSSVPLYQAEWQSTQITEIPGRKSCVLLTRRCTLQKLRGKTALAPPNNSQNYHDYFFLGSAIS